MAGAFLHDYWGYTALRFFAGIVGKGCFLVGFIIVMEIVGAKYKMYLGILITVGAIQGAIQLLDCVPELSGFHTLFCNVSNVKLILLTILQSRPLAVSASKQRVAHKSKICRIVHSGDHPDGKFTLKGNGP